MTVLGGQPRPIRRNRLHHIAITSGDGIPVWENRFSGAECGPALSATAEAKLLPAQSQYIALARVPDAPSPRRVASKYLWAEIGEIAVAYYCVLRAAGKR